MTIGEHWARYRRLVLPDELDEQTLTRLRLSFHAGAIALMREFKAIEQSTDLDAGAVALKTLDDELNGYALTIERDVYQAIRGHSDG